jgi:F-type H+-transporting ATPase subunit gamma
MPMKRESDLRHRLESLENLADAVSAMKSISAHHLRAARRELEPVRRYKEGVDTVIEQSGVELPPAGLGDAGMVVMGSELGLCGGYNARVTEAASQVQDEQGGGQLFCVGNRVATMLKRRGLKPEHTYAMPSGVGGITTLLLKLTEDVLVSYFENGLRRVDLVAARFHGVGDFEVKVSALLPITERMKGTPRKRHDYVSASHIAEVALRELLYITMYSQLIEALASEHGARLLATQSAEKWLNDRTTRVRRLLTAAKREAATQEAIEIASSVRAVRTSEGR